MERFLALLQHRLKELPANSGRYAVALSGGLDSTVLLAALVRVVPRDCVRALHVDHGLHADSGAWEAHCGAVADSLGTGYASCSVNVGGRSGESVEALAREARYEALTELLTPGEVLLTAHHGDDQLETLLLRLLRGSGVKGMRGIAEIDRLGDVLLARPLLRFSREEILAAGRAWGLEWLEDPMNRDLRFDRSFLRARVLPGIRERWPAAGRTAERSARQMAEAQGILDAAARADGKGIEDRGRLRQADLLRLSPPRQRNLLRHHIARQGLPVPGSRQLDALLAALAVRRPDARTEVRWPGGEARIYRGLVYFLAPLGTGSGAGYAGRVSSGEPWTGPEGRLCLVPASGAGLPDVWAREGLGVRFREGGERFRPMRRGQSRPLKKWLQEAGVPPWMRGRIPLLYRDRDLVAVGDLWIGAAAGETDTHGPRWQVSWTGRPPLD